ncbi:MCE family protein [Mycobacterium sp. CBMA271]|uniref:MlaD family protein n=1 Tax=unclassified Mycobacteroides TaxID=2618759 RepID=UPI0012DEAB4A|nr:MULTISPECIES: MCE family protein [unclassified Mycobacteroides]MUM19743.1 mammalian cell entry protein [Mycobacteroides sp. CBMA 326]MUM21101.1 MCE family protein [Mycobacteroides sp. CBMA 271]
MAVNSFETDGRGLSDRHLLWCGVAMVVVAAMVTTALLVKSTGRLNGYVRVVAEMKNVGDGLPAKSDVKYQGVLVGAVDEVAPAPRGGQNIVHINLFPELAHTVPQSVTARVVPSNVFAVSSVQLVAHGRGAAIASGARIQEDTELPTVLFQTTISKLRELLAAVGRGRDDRTVGIFAAVGAATENKRATLLNTGGQLSRVLKDLNGIVATSPGPSTLSALIDATSGLQSTAPELVDALHQAVRPMQTIAEKREQLQSLLSAGGSTLGTVRHAFDSHTDQLINITTNLTPVIGVLAQNASQFLPISERLKTLSDNWFSDAWDADGQMANIRAVISFTPSTTYTRADCPRYGELKGPSCFTAPEIPVRPDLPEVLLPQNYRLPPGLAPPPGTTIGPDGNLMAVGPPLINPNPSLVDPNSPLPWWTGPAPRVPGTADPGDVPSSPGRTESAVAPASFGGNVGPVGSAHEREQLGEISGRDVSSAAQLLLGPVARGMNVVVTQTGSTGGSR